MIWRSLFFFSSLFKSLYHELSNSSSYNYLLVFLMSFGCSVFSFNKKKDFTIQEAETHIEEKNVFALTKLIYTLRSLWSLFTTSCAQVYWLHIEPIGNYYYSITTTNNRKIKEKLEPSISSWQCSFFFFFFFFFRPFPDITFNTTWSRYLRKLIDCEFCLNFFLHSILFVYGSPNNFQFFFSILFLLVFGSFFFIQKGSKVYRMLEIINECIFQRNTTNDLIDSIFSHTKKFIPNADFVDALITMMRPFAWTIKLILNNDIEYKSIQLMLTIKWEMKMKYSSVWIIAHEVDTYSVFS